MDQIYRWYLLKELALSIHGLSRWRLLKKLALSKHGLAVISRVLDQIYRWRMLKELVFSTHSLSNKTSLSLTGKRDQSKTEDTVVKYSVDFYFKILFCVSDAYWYSTTENRVQCHCRPNGARGGFDLVPWVRWARKIRAQNSQCVRHGRDRTPVVVVCNRTCWSLLEKLRVKI